MEVGLVGFPGVGKTTMFSALTGLQAAVGYQGGGDKPNLGVIKVPDPRLDALAAIYAPKKLTPAEIRFVDFPGRAGAKSYALDAKLIAQMRDVEAFALIVRGFTNAAGDPADPVRELSAFFDELVLGVALLAPVGFAGLLAYALGPLMGWWAAVPAGTAALMVIGLETAVAIGWLGRMFERTDPVSALSA